MLLSFQKNVRLISFLGLALIAYLVPVEASEKFATQWVIVDRAIDGDTFRLKDGTSVRLIGINAPEIDHPKGEAEPWAEESWRALGRQVVGGRVRLAFGANLKDAHGRVLAHAFDEAGNLINEQMVAQGLAYVLYVAPNTEFYERLLSTQIKAMAAKKGMWQTLANNDGPVVGNHHSKRFHQGNCPLIDKMRADNKVYLKSRHEAFRQGYAPCKQCNRIPKKKLKHP